MKTCKKCHATKPLSDFYKKQGGTMGVNAQCKTCIDARNKYRYETILKNDPAFIERARIRSGEYHRKYRSRRNAEIIENHRKQRRLCIEHYGPYCACCGETRYEFLSIDHTNGGGTQHRKRDGSKICRWLVKNNMPPGFRVLCHNCNQAIGYYGTCPHVAQTNIS